jgi:hypothetical protein
MPATQVMPADNAFNLVRFFENPIIGNVPNLVVPMVVNHMTYLYSYAWMNPTMQFQMLMNISVPPPAIIAYPINFPLLINSTQSPTGSPLYFFCTEGMAGYVDLWAWKIYAFQNADTMTNSAGFVWLPSSPNNVYVVNSNQQICVWNIMTLEMVGKASISIEYSSVITLMNIGSYVVLYAFQGGEIYSTEVLLSWTETDFMNLMPDPITNTFVTTGGEPPLSNLPFQGQILATYEGYPYLISPQLVITGLPHVNSSFDSFIQLIDGTSTAIILSVQESTSQALPQYGFYVYDLENPSNPMFNLLNGFAGYPVGDLYSGWAISVPQMYQSMFPFDLLTLFEASGGFNATYYLVPFVTM